MCLLECMRFSTLIPLITDDINKLSFLTWSTSRYRVLRDLPTFRHKQGVVLSRIVSDKVVSRSRSNWEVWPQAKLQGSCNHMNQKFLGRALGLENEIITSEMLSTIRNEMETRSSRADRTNFGSEDIEWCLFCWHRDGWRLMRIPYASFCMLFSTFIPLITDDMNKLSFLTWLPTFAHIANKSSSLENTWLVRWLLLPPTHWNVSLRYPWKNPEQNWHVLVCHSPSRQPDVGAASFLTRAY